MRNFIIGAIVGASVMGYATGNIKVEVNLGTKEVPTS